MTHIPGLDAYLTREGPEHTCDPHAPFTAQPCIRYRYVFQPKLRLDPPEVGGGWSVIDLPPATSVFDDRAEDAPPVVRFVGEHAWDAAERYVEVRNREAPPPNEDGSAGSCTVCGDFHGEPR